MIAGSVTDSAARKMAGSSGFQRGAPASMHSCTRSTEADAKNPGLRQLSQVAWAARADRDEPAGETIVAGTIPGEAWLEVGMTADPPPGRPHRTRAETGPAKWSRSQAPSTAVRSSCSLYLLTSGVDTPVPLGGEKCRANATSAPAGHANSISRVIPRYRVSRRPASARPPQAPLAPPLWPPAPHSPTVMS